MVWTRLKEALFADERELSVGTAISFFEEQRGDTLDSLDERLQTFRESFNREVEELENHLEILNDYEDHEGRSIIEDVLSNIYSKKKKLIDGLTIPDEPGALQERMEAFVEQFQTLTRKEREVLKQAGETSDEVFSKLREVKQLQEKFNGFLNDDYSVVYRYERVKELCSAIRDLIEEQEELMERAEAVDTAAVRDAIQEAEEERDAFEQDARWDEREELEEERQRLQDKKRELEKRIQRPFSRLERGLKKVLYRVENGSIDLPDGYTEALEELQQEQVTGERTFEALARVASIVEEKDILSGRYQQTFLDAINECNEVPSLREEHEELLDEIDKVEDRLDGFELEERQEELEDRVDELRERLGEKQELEERLHSRADQVKAEIREKVDELEAVLNEEFLDAIRVTYPEQAVSG